MLTSLTFAMNYDQQSSYFQFHNAFFFKDTRKINYDKDFDHNLKSIIDTSRNIFINSLYIINEEEYQLISPIIQNIVNRTFEDFVNSILKLIFGNCDFFHETTLTIMRRPININNGIKFINKINEYFIILLSNLSHQEKQTKLQQEFQNQYQKFYSDENLINQKQNNDEQIIKIFEKKIQQPNVTKKEIQQITLNIENISKQNKELTDHCYKQIITNNKNNKLLKTGLIISISLNFIFLSYMFYISIKKQKSTKNLDMEDQLD